jgi:hypothetical protein
MWHVNSLLGNDSEARIYTRAVTKQQLVNNKRCDLISVRSVPRYYKQQTLGIGKGPGEGNSVLGDITA